MNPAAATLAANPALGARICDEPGSLALPASINPLLPRYSSARVFSTRFLQWLAIIPALLAGSTCAVADRPNILLVLADDLGWADVGYHGNRIKTPHIDELARTGVVLDQHYVAPVCSPTRCNAMTGRYWSRFGVNGVVSRRAMAFDTVTVAVAMKAAGYDTAITGKWHLGSLPEWGPRKFGFDHSYGSLGGGTGPYDHS